MSFGRALSVALMFFALPAAAQAQQSQGVANSLGGEAAILNALKARGAVQAGAPRSQTGNFAWISQTGDNNRSTIIQRGEANVAITSIRGSGNETFQEQLGARNRSSITVSDGDHNRVQTHQVGSGNYLGLTLRNTDNMSLEYSQVDSGMNAAEQNIVIDSNAQTPTAIVIQQTKR
ncbi:hypothetical protein [Aureimonas pseudogalii]|uniref:Curlin associated repeat-containing protein n=1 Tax=Aureimonas pseudogalii TaxID=1744844 RepID=A0A7W6H7U7_9HYPH|nr:hypothetical protein [Aureimonas pseudogalii]MBB4000219.1 hypothetical protein [Aureimonas pseudogalii]